MAPLRRYLRISQYSVLEVRIYLSTPALEASWLLNPRAPVLPRVLAAVRPLVLPKLREENERVKAKGRKKGVKDVVVEDDFEVSVFLVETSTRHAVLTKQKRFREPEVQRTATAGFGRLTGDAEDAAVEIEDDDDGALVDAGPAAASEPEEEGEGAAAAATPRRSKRARTRTTTTDSLFVDSASDSDAADKLPPSKRARDATTTGMDLGLPDGNDDEKKMAMLTRYDGYAIYGRVLCLVVKRRGGATGGGGSGGGQAMMEEWIASTQIPRGVEEEGEGA